LAKLSNHLATSQPAPSGMPILLLDKETSAAVIVWNNDHHKDPLFKAAKCASCPQAFFPANSHVDPNLETGDVFLLATVKHHGAAEDLAATKTFDDAFAESAMRAVRYWNFMPAIGSDGQPFKQRVSVVVTYRLH